MRSAKERVSVTAPESSMIQRLCVCACNALAQRLKQTQHTQTCSIVPCATPHSACTQQPASSHVALDRHCQGNQPHKPQRHLTNNNSDTACFACHATVCSLEQHHTTCDTPSRCSMPVRAPLHCRLCGFARDQAGCRLLRALTAQHCLNVRSCA